MYTTKFNQDLTPWVTNDYIKFSNYFLRNNDYLPPLSINETEENYSVKLTFSNSLKWKIRVFWEDNMLAICGERQVQKGQSRRSKIAQAFKRIIVLPENIISNDGINYEFINCQLRFNLDKQQLKKYA
ncbi:Hsp20/alpha crystallin family protein [uncultured Tenacibaculum sp.]|uniref:Hsp20/alpha crystallin family protein n=1 Tax=uncultured Tenacibaculum sp. TaxID=174713 RepID=UPI002623C96A|nr:Hsp20/alpha crystallin family protein [uncultured Tenacibaculum sp.]